MQHAHLLTVLSIVMLSSMVSASDQKNSIISSLFYSQFPCNSRNSEDKQRRKGDYIVKQTLKDALKSDSLYEYRNFVYAIATASLMTNSQQKLINSRANAGMLGAIPLMCFSKTRHIGVGMSIFAGGLKIEAASQLPHIDVDHVVDTFKQLEVLTDQQQTTVFPSSYQNPSDII